MSGLLSAQTHGAHRPTIGFRSCAANSQVWGGKRGCASRAGGSALVGRLRDRVGAGAFDSGRLDVQGGLA